VLTQSRLLFLSDLFGTDLVRIDAISRQQQSEYWQSEIYAISSPHDDKKYIYKTRLVTPFELMEIESVLGILSTHRIPNICSLVNYKLVNHRIHLLLEYVGGVSLDHSHDLNWSNDSVFEEFLVAIPYISKVKIAYQIVESLYRLHQIGLLYQDIKIEQIILTHNYDAILVDVDTIILRNGHCSKRLTWVSPLYMPPYNLPCESNDIYLTGCLLFELFTGKHYNVNQLHDSGVPNEIQRIIKKMVLFNHKKTLLSSEQIYQEFRRVFCIDDNKTAK